MTLLQDLTASRDLLVTDGWASWKLRDTKTGARCAIGAVLDATGNEHLDDSNYVEMNDRGVAVVNALHEIIPNSAWSHNSLRSRACSVASYNNSAGEQGTLKLFEDAMDRIILPDYVHA